MNWKLRNKRNAGEHLGGPVGDTKGVGRQQGQEKFFSELKKKKEAIKFKKISL